MKFAELEVSLYRIWQNNYEIMSADLKVKYLSYQRQFEIRNMFFIWKSQSNRVSKFHRILPYLSDNSFYNISTK